MVMLFFLLCLLLFCSKDPRIKVNRVDIKKTNKTVQFKVEFENLNNLEENYKIVNSIKATVNYLTADSKMAKVKLTSQNYFSNNATLVIEDQCIRFEVWNLPQNGEEFQFQVEEDRYFQRYPQIQGQKAKKTPFEVFFFLEK